MRRKLSLEISPEHPAYLWAKNQSDSVNAFGHIGTHIDCYSTSPKASIYELDVVLVDCRYGMPERMDIKSRGLENTALILYTGALNKYGYGTKEYGEEKTFLTETILDSILSLRPKFILIDACGIGHHGDEHIQFDKKCEKNDCFVIENVFMDETIAASTKKVNIIISSKSLSTGKPCQVYAITD